MGTPSKKLEPQISAPLNVRLNAAERAGNPLLEAARPLLAALTGTPSQLDAEGAGQRHQWIMHEIRLFDRVCKALRLRPDHVEHVRYTLAAALDEAARQQPWGREDGGNAQWSQGVAVALGYGRQGGDQVFRLIERALHSPEDNAPLLDVFRHVLEAGFMGRYRHDRSGRAQLAAIGASLSRAVENGRPQSFPAARNRSTATGLNEPGKLRGLNGLRINLPVTTRVATPVRRRRLLLAGSIAAIFVAGGLIYALCRLAKTPPPTPAPAAATAALDVLAQRLTTRLRSEIAAGTLSIAEDPARTALTIGFGDMFGPGESAVHTWLGSLIIAAGEEIAVLPLKADVAGYTDNLPSKRGRPSNQALSEARAASIKQFLLAAGVSPDRVNVTGKGDANPRSDNATDEGRTKNRRVEITVTELPRASIRAADRRPPAALSGTSSPQ